MINPMESLPGFGAILKEKCKLNTSDEDRTIGDLIGACMDFIIGRAWSYMGLFPEEEADHRNGMSILEVQNFIDWAMNNLIAEMEWDKDEVNEIAHKGIEAFRKRQEEAEEEGRT